MSLLPLCDRCGKPVNHRTAWYSVEGWAKPRDAGGANHIALRRPTGRLMHDGCMHLALSGVADDQQSMFGDAA